MNPPPPQASSVALSAEGLTKRYGGVTAVDDLSFSVRRGAVTGFLGPNGAGKTTVLAMLAGLARPTGGRVLIDGVPLQDGRPDARQVGVVIAACGAHPGRSARQHLRILARYAGLPRARIKEVLTLVGLDAVASRRIGTFSLGMRQRLHLASALLGDPEILLLDEPINGLDPEGIHWLRNLLHDQAERGRTVLVSSHLLGEAFLTVDDVVVIRGGRLLRAGPIGDLVRPGGLWVRASDPGRLLEAVHRAGGRVRQGAPGAGGRDLVEGLTAPAVVDLARRMEVDLHELTPRSASLEDAFLDLTGAQS